jgi:hypothetical protein
MQTGEHTSYWASCDAVVRVPRRRTDVLAERLDDEGILVDPDSGQIHRLNETSLAVWNACDGSAWTREVARGMTEQYEVSFEDALDYVEQLLAWMAESNLVELESDG